jgi:predicted DNA-binding transcriptional regulator YafY
MAQPRGLGNPRLAAAAQSALNKLMAAMPEPLKMQAEHLRQRLHVDPTGWRATGEDLSMLSAVQDAVARDRKLTFDYTRADGEQSSRTVDPLGLVSKGLNWYLVARAANGMRTFRVSRMKRVTVLAVGFERPARFDLVAHWQSSTAELDRKRASYGAILSLTAEAARRIQAWCVTRPAAAGAAGRKSDAERTVLQVDFDNEGQAKFIVLGLGAAVRVLEPESLRGRVEEEAREVARTAKEA